MMGAREYKMKKRQQVIHINLIPYIMGLGLKKQLDPCPDFKGVPLLRLNGV